MKNYNKIIAVAMAGAICGSTAFSSISLAATKSSEKEEVIYANLTSSGEIEKIYAVNIFEDKDIVDYGVYETVKNMNTMDKINYSNGKITIQNSEDKLYYQGVMKQNTQMPWTIKVRYKLDGVEYAPSELAGKSGKLEISISIKENKNCKKNFFENYALQTVVQLDTNLCENIKSDEATMANVGGLKQLTYTILPGNEKDIKITTDVTDFEMSEIQVNGINLNLGLDKDSIDTSSLTGELDKLKDAVNDLDDGANELNDGAKKLDDGAVTLTDGIKTIQEGLDQLNSKSSSLTSGSSEVLSALKTIQSSLNNVSTSSKDLKQLSGSSGLTALLGITEPAMFGVNLKMKYPFYAAMVGSAVGCAYVTLTNVLNISPGAAGIIGFVCIKSGGMLNYMIGIAISLIVGFVLTMGLSKMKRFSKA